MLMIVIGAGGTGKSTLLNTITTTFEKLNAQHLLKKTAMSGVAASLVGGTTLHWLAGLPASSDVPARLGLKATALAWLSMAQAFRISRPGQSHQ
jgi:ABC-type branched-subunit amino acid transport system ATPase component